MLKLTISLFVLSLLTGTVEAQEQPTGDATSGNSNQQQYGTVDCTDPLLSGSSQCTQGNQERDYGLQPGNENGAPGTLQRGQFPGNGTYGTKKKNGTLTPKAQNRNPAQRNPPPAEPLPQFQKFVASST